MKNKERKLLLQRLLVDLENPYPKDDLILSYADFLKVRSYLDHYQFNPIVLDNLVAIANNEWKTKKRINRLSLLLRIKHYFLASQIESRYNCYDREFKPGCDVAMETRKQLFALFKKTYEDWKYISYKQLEQVRTICNHILIKLALTPEEEAWLCAHYTLSDHILNRILRYPVKSAIISRWAKENYHNPTLRHRRPELASWLIDQDPSFEIDCQTLIDDFEYLNKRDKQAIQNFKDELVASRMIEAELAEYLPKEEHNDRWENNENSSAVYASTPDLKLSKRPYPVTSRPDKICFQDIPDFNALQVYFYTNLPKFHLSTMIWAITYSRLDNEQKCVLLQKYYTPETFPTLLRICKKNKNIVFVKWLLENQ